MVVIGENVLHHVKREEELSGRENVRGKCRTLSDTLTRQKNIHVERKREANELRRNDGAESQWAETWLAMLKASKGKGKDNTCYDSWPTVLYDSESGSWLVWYEPMAPQRIIAGAASRHTNAPISHTRHPARRYCSKWATTYFPSSWG